MPKISKKCEYCGKEFYSYASLKRKYCSKDCKYLSFNKGNEIRYVNNYVEMQICNSIAVFDKCDYGLVKPFTWRLDKGGYAIANNYKRSGLDINKKSILMHRLIMGHPIGKQIDHINQNPLDNRKENLRLVSNFENSSNKKYRNKLNIIGVRKVGKKYKAYINQNKKFIHLGGFDTLEEAKKARKDAERKYFNVE